MAISISVQRILISSFFSAIVFVDTHFPWILNFALNCVSVVIKFLYSPIFSYFLPSLISFLMAFILDSQYDFLNFLRRIRIGLDEHVLYTMAYFPFIWTMASYVFITSKSFAVLASATWFIIVRYLLKRERNFNYKKLCFGLITTVIYFMNCQKVCNSYFGTTTENQVWSSRCSPGNN